MLKGNNFFNWTGLLLLLLSMASADVYAQLRLKVELDRDSILIGEQVQLKYTAFRNARDEIQWPNFTGKIKASDGSEIEIIEQSEIRVYQEEGAQVREEKSLVITVFDSGYYVIPPAVFAFKSEKDSSFKKVDSEAELLSVYTLEIDAESGPKAIKDPMDLPFKIAEIKNELFLLAIVLALLIGAYIWWKKRPKALPKEAEPEPEIIIPPYELAMQRLKDLESKKLWQNGMLKPYYSELSEVLREYLEGRFEFPALESTTDEIVDRLYRKDMDRALKIRVKEFLVLSDLVKFAKSLPKEDEHRESFKLVLEFIRTTKLEEDKEVGNA